MHTLENYEHDETFLYFKDKNVTVFSGVFILLIFMYSLILPFYLFVGKINREKDKSTILYPITNHFSVMVKIGYLVFTLMMVGFLIICKFKIFNFPLKALNISTFYIAYVSTQTFHLLIFLLAAERFVLFFFPHTEKSILILWKKLKIWHIYAAVIVKEVACFMDAIYELYRSSGTDSLRIVTVYGITCVVLSVLLLVSALLYVPIMFRIRKFTHLVSAQTNKPHKYIFWQTMIVIIFKSIYIPVLLFSMRDGYFSSSVFISMVLVTDFITTPLIIQISYLTCTKRNITLMFSSFTTVLNSLNLKYGSSIVRPMESSTQNPNEFQKL
ncbi:Serpentine Receptor, class Z [Caenorhabditis elegans]|uniref:Serpentine Receptor, class Z n=1 Tax=Caenorhabditis elegans TaxID=6239 RepID=Q7YTQ2_CAEEL|nr:Serpentine Receptor, class Z [Caenorhabditis elegans]CAE17759.1 Serpentine Receptor, class Z [Caenorhabditis elegans]|eukprot:NP_001023738.1 Serpentine Receptor, class Z [Caenorhabditis elegans]